MPGKLVFFVICMVLLLLFAGFNMKNVSDISFGFYEFTEVPIFISLLFAFILGILFCVPIMASGKPKKKDIDTTGNINIFPVEDPKLSAWQKNKLKKAEKAAKKAKPSTETEPEDAPPVL